MCDRADSPDSDPRPTPELIAVALAEMDEPERPGLGAIASLQFRGSLEVFEMDSIFRLAFSHLQMTLAISPVI